MAQYTLAQLRAQLSATKQRLGLERLNILQIYPLKSHDNREIYGFAYLQAERLCLQAIQNGLENMTWLPAKLDISTEINSDTRHRMTRWIKLGDNIAPGEEIFGNGFVHALTRCILLTGADSGATRHLSERIGHLFCELTCLVAAMHCLNICHDCGLDLVELSSPHNLSRTAFELTLVTESLLMLMEEEMIADDGQADNVAENQNRPPFPAYLRLVPDTPSSQNPTDYPA